MKKRILQTSLLLTLLLLLSGCFRNDIRTQTFQIEQMRSTAGATKLAEALAKLPGVTQVQPDIDGRELTVTFNGRQLFLKNIEFAIVKAGFDLPNWPAQPEDKAKLPKELQ